MIRVALALLLTATAAHAQDVSALLKTKAQALQDAIAPGKAQVWADILDDQMLMSDETGAVTDKKQAVTQIQPLPPGASGYSGQARSARNRNGHNQIGVMPTSRWKTSRNFAIASIGISTSCTTGSSGCCPRARATRGRPMVHSL